MKNYSITKLVLILAPFVFSFAFGLDIYIPIVPQMTDIYETSPAMVQLTLSLFLLITGVGQIFIGPISDQFGRKPVMYVSAVCYAIGSLGCAFAGDIVWLIIARIISAIGACGMLVTAFAMVRDIYHSDASARIYSFLNGAIGISPTFAPIIGGYLAIYLGYSSVFIFLFAIGCFSLLVTNRYIRETVPCERRVKIDKEIVKRYFQIFLDKQFITYAFIAGFAESIFFCFFSISPFIIIDLNNVPTHQFGYYFAIFGAVISLGGLSSAKLIKKIGMKDTIRLGIALMFIGGISMLSWYYVASLSLKGFLIPMAIACTGAIFLVGCSASIAMENFSHIAGTAAAAFGALEFTISSLIGSILMLLPPISTVPYGVIIVIMAILCLCLSTAKIKKVESEVS